MTTVQHADTHREVVDVTNPERRPRVLMVVANPTVSTITGWPVGFWAAELFHPYYEFSQKRYAITIASPEGGKVTVDALSDPRDPSKWSADDLISLGALNAPDITAQLEDTPALRDPPVASGTPRRASELNAASITNAVLPTEEAPRACAIAATKG